MIKNQETVMYDAARNQPAASKATSENGHYQQYRQAVLDFFNDRFFCWSHVYGGNLPQSYELPAKAAVSGS